MVLAQGRPSPVIAILRSHGVRIELNGDDGIGECEAKRQGLDQPGEIPRRDRIGAPPAKGHAPDPCT